MRVVCISDTHNHRIAVPDGDLLLHAGDATARGTTKQILAFNEWLGSLPHRHKVIISGNHDFGFERDPEARNLITNATYLQDEEVTVDGVRIWGTPWQPRFYDWAFNLDRGEPLRAIWAKVPTGIDILLCHGPPQGILDRCHDGARVGCEELTAALSRIRPRLCVFGHIHEDHGKLHRDGTLFVNASICNLQYQPVQPPFVVDL